MKTQNQNKYPTRTVTGVVTFDQDYSGVFIRCDHDEHVAKMLELVL